MQESKKFRIRYENNFKRMYFLGTEGFVQIQALQIVQIKGCSARAITCSARYSDPCLPLLYTFIMSITDWRKVSLCFEFGNET